MLFNSFEFLIFLPIVFCLYWFVFQGNLGRQNLFILLASYVFYGSWSWKFLLLIAFTSFSSYASGILIERSKSQRVRYVVNASNIVINLLVLGFFKYFNFFIESFVEVFARLGVELHVHTLQIILPVGISFYTFQALSYSIDVYRQRIKASGDIVSFFAFISFFPQLVAGPIERASNLLPQFAGPRTFDRTKSVDGLRQILWGLFKKVVIADNCAKFANSIFDHSTEHSGSTLVLGALFFSIQIYGDFSGYSDIAIGTARLFGFDLKRNFAYPHFSRSIPEFWRRWHISLSSWFRDYLYIPLGGSRGSLWLKVRNVFIVFIVTGFWHGANWTFLAWGFLHALYMMPSIFLQTNRKNLDVVASGKSCPSLRELGSMLRSFILVALALIFFRSQNMDHALSYLAGVFSPTLFTLPSIESVKWQSITGVLIVFFYAIEWIGRATPHALFAFGSSWSRSRRWVFYYMLVLLIIYFSGSEQTFIYFQF
ncbi:O-acyltransferase [Bacteroidales bacterium]|nr:O-acyltransferase [Bacteroidales bacterium]